MSRMISVASAKTGRGHIGIQNMLGKVDIVMGSFSKTFASNGGFVACPSRSVQQYLRYFSTPGTFSNALSPIQAAVVLTAFEIVDSEEGRNLRASLMANVLALRGGLRRGRLRGLRRTVGDRGGQDGQRSDRPPGRPATGDARPGRQHGRISRRWPKAPRGSACR